MTALLRFARSNAVGLVALLVALSGTAYAAAALPRNSVGPVQLRTNAVTGRDIATGGVGPTDLGTAAVNGRSIHNRSVGRIDLAGSATAFVDGGARQSGGDDPPASGGAGVQLVSIRSVTLPRAGRVLVNHFSPRLGMSCSAGVPMMGLYWDEVPVPDSGVNMASSADPRAVSLVAVVTSTGGQHDAAAGWYCSTGATPGSSTINTNVTWSFVMP